MQFLNKTNSKKTRFHLLFWLSFYLIHLTTNKYNYSNNFHLAYIFFWHIVLQAIASYVLLDFIILKFLNKRKYFVAAAAFLGLAIHYGFGIDYSQTLSCNKIS